MNKKGKILNEKQAFNGHIFQVVNRKIKTPDSLIVQRQIVLHSPSVALIAPIHINNELKFAIGTEYRAGFNSERTSFPAGLINSGEQPSQAALRETREEIGLIYQKAEEIFQISSSEGFTNEVVHLMLLKKLTKKTKKNFDLGEFVKTNFLTFKELEKQVLLKKITAAPGIIGYMWLKLHPKVLKKL